MSTRQLGRAALVTIVTLPVVAMLTACVAKATDSIVRVNLSDANCVVQTATVPAGVTSFSITNSGTTVFEFELVAADQSTMVSEKENIGPGTTVTHTVDLMAGTYYAGCLPGQVGPLQHLTEFTVTGDRTTATLSPAQQEAVAAYLNFVRAEVARLRTDTEAFTAAYASGDDIEARARYASTRSHYEQIEPIAESFGDLDPRIDNREVDAVADGDTWSGFHRIEKDLWPPTAGTLNSDGTDALTGWTPSTPAERAHWAEQLTQDVAELDATVNAANFTLSPAEISNGAIALLDEVASGKLTGEEEWWSGVDLVDIAANIAGSEQAFTAVAPLTQDASLRASIEERFAALHSELATYGSLEAGFPPFTTLTNSEIKHLSDLVNALAEPLSRLTADIVSAK
ncbi:MAG: iron uptake system protein EfeO [Agromyces sp.]